MSTAPRQFQSAREALEAIERITAARPGRHLGCALILEHHHALGPMVTLARYGIRRLTNSYDLLTEEGLAERWAEFLQDCVEGVHK